MKQSFIKTLSVVAVICLSFGLIACNNSNTAKEISKEAHLSESKTDSKEAKWQRPKATATYGKGMTVGTTQKAEEETKADSTVTPQPTKEPKEETQKTAEATPQRSTQSTQAPQRTAQPTPTPQRTVRQSTPQPTPPPHVHNFMPTVVGYETETVILQEGHYETETYQEWEGSPCCNHCGADLGIMTDEEADAHIDMEMDNAIAEGKFGKPGDLRGSYGTRMRLHTKTREVYIPPVTEDRQIPITKNVCSCGAVQ